MQQFLRGDVITVSQSQQTEDLVQNEFLFMYFCLHFPAVNNNSKYAIVVINAVWWENGQMD